MKCPKCGTDIPAGTMQCPGCGQKFMVAKRCPHCGSTIPASASVCSNCKQAVAVSNPFASSRKKQSSFRWWRIPIYIFVLIIGFGIGSVYTRQAILSNVASAFNQFTSSATDDVSATVSVPQKEDAPSSPAQPEPQNQTFAMGETWTVDGQWSLNITGVEETAERNEFSDKTPSAVYLVKYTYTNLGYEDESGLMDGLYFSLDNGVIVDNAGTVGHSYPVTPTNIPQEAPVSATCNAEGIIAVDNPGSFKLTLTKYDSNGQKQSATFDITL